MAEGGHPSDVDLQQLECPICLEPLQQPKSLPCLHSFCQECLGTYITKGLSGKKASATSFPCPVCRRMTSPVNQTEATDTWAGQFPTNSVILDLIKLKGDPSKPLFCKPCQTKGNIASPAKFWCKTMNINFCESCKVEHHDILHNDCDLMINATVNGDPHFNLDNFVIRCEPHGKKIVRYCEDHKRLCCNECVIEDHRGCGNVTKTTEYFKKLKEESQLEEMQAALKKGSEVMDSFVKDFDEQLKVMVHNQELALQSISDLREKVDKRLDKLQKDITDELIRLFKKEQRYLKASSEQCQNMMTDMHNTLKSTTSAVAKNNHNETIVLYQRGQADVESCKTLVTEISKSLTSVRIVHKIVPGSDIFSDQAMGKIVVEKQSRCVPRTRSNVVKPMSERRVKEIGRFSIKTPSDKHSCSVPGVVYLPCAQIVISDFTNKKLKLFTDKGQYLDEMIVPEYTWDVCLVDRNTVAVAVYAPGGIRVVKVEASKLLLSSEINLSNFGNCYGITYMDGGFVVGTGLGEVYSVTRDGTASLLTKYGNACCYLTHDQVNKNTFVSDTTPGEIAVSRTSDVKHNMDALKVNIVRGGMEIDADREGNIYVCCTRLHCVVQISGDGKRVRELLTILNRMAYPWAISVCGDTFVVSNSLETDDRNYIRVFQLC